MELSGSEAATLQDVMKDGVITQEERARLGFLSQDTINTIAGDDGKKPLQLKASMLISKLAKAGLKDAYEYIEKIAALGPEASAQFMPVARTLLNRLMIAIGNASVTHDRLDMQRRDLLTIRNRLEEAIDKRAGIPSNAPGSFESYINRAIEYKAMAPRLDAIQRQIDAVDAQYNLYPLEAHKETLSKLVHYLGGLTPPPDFLVPAIQNGTKHDTAHLDIAEATIQSLIDSGNPAALQIVREVGQKHPGDVFKYLLQIGDIIDLQSFINGPHVFNNFCIPMLKRFVTNKRPALEAAVIQILSSPVRAREILTAYQEGDCIYYHEKAREKGMATIRNAVNQLSLPSLKAIVESGAIDEAITNVLVSTTSDAANEAMVKIINGEIKTTEKIRKELIAQLPSLFFDRNIAAFTPEAIKTMSAVRLHKH
ncbi:MAG: hypothetical protein WC956_05205 [bacterium]